jgi:hypothetical protein
MSWFSKFPVGAPVLVKGANGHDARVGVVVPVPAGLARREWGIPVLLVEDDDRPQMGFFPPSALEAYQPSRRNPDMKAMDAK